LGVKVQIKAFSAAGARKRLPSRSITDFQASEIRYGGFADFTLTLAAGPHDLPALVATDRVELWVGGILRYRGEVTGRDRSPDEPPKLTLTGYGRMLRVGSHIAHQRYAYPTPYDAATALRDVVRDWVAPFETRPLSVRTVPLGFTLNSLDCYIKLTKDAFDEAIKLTGNQAIWGVDVLTDPGDAEYLTDRFYVEPLSTGTDWVIPTPSKRTGNTQAQEQTDKVVNTLFIVGGTPRYPNLLYNGGFERPIFAGTGGIGNLLNSDSFEDRNHWNVFGGADFKSTGLSEGAAYDGGNMVQADSVGEGFSQTRDNNAQIVPGHDYEFGGHFRRQAGSTACTGEIVITWRDAGGNQVSQDVMAPSYLAPSDATWRYYYQTARCPAGATGFDFRFQVVTIADGSTNQGRGFVCDSMRFFDASIIRQDHWQIDTFGSAQVTAQNWSYPDFYDDGNGYNIGGRSVYIAQTSQNQDGQDIHLSQGANRMDVTGNQGVKFQVFAKLPPGVANNSRFLLEMHTYRSDGSECGNPNKQVIAAGAMAPGGWYLWNAGFNCASDAVKLECYVTFRGSGGLIFDGLCVRDTAAYDPARPGDFYIPDGPLQAKFRAATELAGDPAHAAEAASEATYGVKSEIVTEDALTTLTDARAYAVAYFRANALPPLTPSVERQDDPSRYRCGQTVKLAGATGPLVGSKAAPIVKITHRYNGLYSVLLELEREQPDQGAVILEQMRKLLGKQDNGGGGTFNGTSQGTSSGGGAATGSSAEVIAARTRTVKNVVAPTLETRLDAMEVDILNAAAPNAGVPSVPAWLFEKVNIDIYTAAADFTPFVAAIALPLTTQNGDLVDLNSSGAARTTAWGEKSRYTTELTVTSARTIQVQCTADNGARCLLNGVQAGTDFGNTFGGPGSFGGSGPLTITLNLTQGRNMLQFLYYNDNDAGGANSGFTCKGVGSPLALLVDQMLAPFPATAAAQGGSSSAGTGALPFWRGRAYLNGIAGNTADLDASYFAGGSRFPAGTAQRTFKAPAGADGSVVWETQIPLAVWLRLGLRNTTGAGINVPFWLPLARAGAALVWAGASIFQRDGADAQTADLAGTFTVAAGAQGVLDLFFYAQSQPGFGQLPPAAPAAPTTNSICIYRALASAAPAAVPSLVGVIPDPGGAWSWSDPGPLLPGALYTYAAKRYRASDGTFSAFSASVQQTGPALPSGAFTLFLSALDQAGLTFYDPGQ